MKKKINIGFDLGVASVGWSIYSVDDDKFIDWGVKLFEQSKKAEDRRSARGLRRRYRRQTHRIERFNKLLQESNIKYEMSKDNDLLSKRIIGINEKINQQDLLNILRFFLKYRGYNPIADDTRENSYKKRYPDLYACEIQNIIKEETGSYRGLEFPFLIEDFNKEIKQLLTIQKEFHTFITTEFIEQYLKILNSRRNFWEGPGGAREDQLTLFGRYRNEKDLEEFNKDENYRKYLYEELIKDCSIYLGEKSVTVHNYYAQRFNFLNDMINIRIPIVNMEDNVMHSELLENKIIQIKDKDNYKLTLKGINKIEEEVLKANKINYDTIFNNVIGLKLNKLSGYRIDRDKKPEITKFEGYKKAINSLNKNESELNIIDNKGLWNEIAYYITVVPSSNIEETLKRIEGLSAKDINILKDLKLDSNYHSYSEKALKVYIELMENQLENSSYIERNYEEQINSDVRSNFINNYFNNGDKSHKVSKKYIDDLVASPQVKKSLRKAITTLNEIKKEYIDKKGYEIQYIVVESNKELLPQKKQSEYETNQNGNERKRKKAEEEYNKDSKSLNKNKFIEKYLLLDENNFKCVYCDDVINIENMETEHILPRTKTADDSFSNKSCACKKCNENKSGKTPYEWMGASSNFIEFEKRVEKNKNFTSEKREKLLFKENINKYSKQFIARNLRDTAYVTKEFKNQLDLYKGALELKFGEKANFNILTMPPKITGMVRKNTVQKDRENKYHHAFDASIAAYYPQTQVGSISDTIQNDPSAYWKGESFNKFLANGFKKEMIILPQEITSQLKQIDYTNTKFHFEIKKNPNGQISNSDINKVLIDEKAKSKEKYKKVEYIADIYTEEKIDDLAKYFDLEIKKGEVLEKESSKTLGIKQRDYKTFNWLKEIYKQYYGLKWKYENGEEGRKVMNPFKYYACEQNEISPDNFIIEKHGIRPISKKGKERPIIKRLNYTTNVTRPFLLNKNDVELNEGNYIMLDNVKAAYTKIYKNLDKGGFIFIPMYSIFFDLKTGKLNENYEDNPYYKQLWEDLIGETNVEFYMDVRTNEYLVAEKKDGSIVEGCFGGYHKTHKKLEVKNTSSGIAPSVVKIKKIPIYGLGTIVKNIY